MPGRIPSHLLPRIAAMVALIAGLALASFGTADDAAAEAGVTNNCPAGEKSVALYGGVVTRGMVAADSLDTFTGYCVQVIASSDWEQMSVAEFEQFDVLWIGNDECMDWGDAAGKLNRIWRESLVPAQRFGSPEKDRIAAPKASPRAVSGSRNLKR